MAESKLNRRGFLKISAAAAAAAAGTAALGIGGSGVTHAQDADTGKGDAVAHNWYDLNLIGDSLMDERLLFYLGHTWYRMADIGECLDTASRIEAGNSAGWRAEWYRTADRLRAAGDASRSAGHAISAGEAFLRASSYYLAGLIYTETPTDPEMLRASRASAETFESAMRLLGIPAEPVNIPYENSVLPAYFFRSPLATGRAPLIIFHEGMDASVEEALFIGQEAIRRGYHALLFHHPGQGQALREYGLTFRPDWENVITPVVDYAVQQPEVDPDRMALLGWSFGGALITRAVAFEKRIKIGVANPAVYNWSGFIENFLFGSYPEMGALLESDPDAFNTAIAGFLDQAPSMFRWWLSSAMWKYGAESPADLLIKLRAYSNADILDKVTCTMLIMDGEGETWAAGQAKMVYDALTCPKDYMLFTAEDTGLLHDQPGATGVAMERLYNWLDEYL